MKFRIRRARGRFLERIAAMVDAQAEERLAAYRAGFDAGFLAGLDAASDNSAVAR